MKATNIYQKLRSAGAISPLHQEDPPIETQQEQGDRTPVEPVSEVESSGPVDTYTKREGISDATGFLGTRQDRLASAEAGKSLAAEVGAGVLAGALGAPAGVGLGAMAAGAGARTLGNLAQNEVARRRVEKFGQEGSAIVPNLTYKQGGMGDVGTKALMGEKTYTGEDPKLERIKARNFRRKWRAEKRAQNRAARLAKKDAYKAERQKGRAEREMIREGSPATFAKTNSAGAYSNATTVNPSALKSSPITQKAKQGELKTWNEGKPNVIGASGNLGLVGGILGGAAKTFSRLTGIGGKKSFWPQRKNTGDLYAKAKARKASESVPKKPNQPNINFARKTDVIGKGESYGNVRAFNKPGMKKTHFGPKK